MLDRLFHNTYLFTCAATSMNGTDSTYTFVLIILCNMMMNSSRLFFRTVPAPSTSYNIVGRDDCNDYNELKAQMSSLLLSIEWQALKFYVWFFWFSAKPSILWLHFCSFMYLFLFLWIKKSRMMNGFKGWDSYLNKKRSMTDELMEQKIDSFNNGLWYTVGGYQW